MLIVGKAISTSLKEKEKLRKKFQILLNRFQRINFWNDFSVVNCTKFKYMLSLQVLALRIAVKEILFKKYFLKFEIT